MRLFSTLAIIVCFLFSVNAFAQDIEPVISNNVHVLKNVSPAQCPSSWKGTTGSADILADTATGVSNQEVAAGIRSCDSCAYDKTSGDCVCATCYDEFN